MCVKKNIILICYFIRSKANSITAVNYVMNLCKKNVINFEIANYAMLCYAMLCY